MSNIKEYWEKATPMKFKEEHWSYEKKRLFRYGLQHYMMEVFDWDGWRGKRVLEVGCGSGIDAVEFAQNGAMVTAVDITKGAVEATSELAKEAGVKLTAFRIDEEKALPFKDHTFDCIYSYGVLHHIPNVARVLQDMYRVLRPSGRVMAMLYNKNSLLFAYSIVFLHLDEWDSTDMGLQVLASKYSERNIGCPYTHCYTKEEAANIFEMARFTDVEVLVRYNVIDLPGKRKVKIPVSDELEIGWHLIVKAKRLDK